ENCPIPGFADHYNSICDLLLAYETIYGRESSWADNIIAQWADQLRSDSKENDNELEEPIMEILRVDDTLDAVSCTVQGERGTLYITEAGILLSRLHKLR